MTSEYFYRLDVKDVYFATQIARAQLSMNMGHLAAIIIVPMISVLSVKAFNYNWIHHLTTQNALFYAGKNFNTRKKIGQYGDRTRDIRVISTTL